jgi:hypothetical protein
MVAMLSLSLGWSQTSVRWIIREVGPKRGKQLTLHCFDPKHFDHREALMQGIRAIPSLIFSQS